MKKGIHPEYGYVAFRDISTGNIFVTRSTLASRSSLPRIEVTGLDVSDVPVIDVDITSESHPFWTGKSRVLDAEGRVNAFERRYGLKK
jgi:large subunit ribosomal protein L31